MTDSQFSKQFYCLTKFISHPTSGEFVILKGAEKIETDLWTKTHLIHSFTNKSDNWKLLNSLFVTPPICIIEPTFKHLKQFLTTFRQKFICFTLVSSFHLCKLCLSFTKSSSFLAGSYIDTWVAYKWQFSFFKISQI